MIDSVLNLIFCCSHKRLTRPVTPIDKDGKPHGDTYVVCLACGKQFSYDLKEMRIGKPLPWRGLGPAPLLAKKPASAPFPDAPRRCRHPAATHPRPECR